MEGEGEREIWIKCLPWGWKKILLISPLHNGLLPRWLASAREMMFLIVIVANWHLFPESSFLLN